MKKVSKAAKRRLTIFGTFSLLAIVYFSINFITYTVKIINLKKTDELLANRLENLKTEEKELSTEIVKLSDPEYIARYAREKYQYSKDGEYIIQINKEKEVEENVSDDNNYNIIILSTVIVGSVVILLKKISHI